MSNRITDNKAAMMERGRWYCVYWDINPDGNLFEGMKTACIRWMKENNYWNLYKTGTIRLGKLLWEELK